MAAPPTDRPPDLSDIEAAAGRLDGIAARTPLLEHSGLNRRLGGRLLLKAEALQHTGSFKFRGAYNAISQLSPAERAEGIVAYSSGNHAQGVAAAAHRLGAPAIIVMPDDAPAAKRDGTAAWGAAIVPYDRRDHDARETIAAKIIAERGGHLIPPFDDARIIAGQGTVGLEILDQAAAAGAELDAVLIPCGGGGLSSGIATALKARKPETEIFTVEPEGFDDTARSLRHGERQRNPDGAVGLCDALLAPSPGVLTFSILRRLASGGLVVRDDDVMAAIATAARELKVTVEPGGAVALAAVLAETCDIAGRTVAVVLSGGNIDEALLCRALTAKMPPMAERG